MARSTNDAKLARFLAGAQVGRENSKPMTFAELEAETVAGENLKWLKIGQKIWSDLKWKLKKKDHTKQEALELVNDALIDVGTKVKHETIKKEIIKRLEAIKADLEKPTK
jgi:hypothetical protein